MKIKLIAILTLVFLISCVTAQTPKKPTAAKTPETAERESARVPGELSREDGAISVPASIVAGQPFEVTVITTGNGCVSQGDTGVILDDSSADVFVYDLTTATGPATACTMIFKTFEHKAKLQFAKRGEAVIRFWVRSSGGSSPLGEPVVMEKRVMVK